MEYNLFDDETLLDDPFAGNDPCDPWCIGFALVQRPGVAEVRFHDEVILTIVQEQLIVRQMVMGQAKMRPGGPVEIVCFLTSPLYGHRLRRAAVEEVGGDGFTSLTLALTPEYVDEGLDELALETRTLTIEYLPEFDRFRYRVAVDAHFLQDITGGEGLSLTCMPQWGGDDYAVIEFDDPLLAGGIGPQVPMTQDWTGLPEPDFGPDAFTTRWSKRYLSVTMETAERGMQRLAFNRVVNGAQQFYNRHILKSTPGTPYYYQKTDGRYLVMTPLFDAPCGHHICEWGYDMHWYALLAKAAPGVLFARGQRVSLSYTLEEVEMAEVPLACLTARPDVIEPAERPLCDLPIYEEPVCTFAKSTLDHPDAYGFRLEGQGAWQREGGKEAGHGALTITHGAEGGTSTWRFIHFGPSYATNPIPPMSRHRVAAWVKADDLDAVTLTFTLDAHQGPAMYSPRVPVVSTATAAHITARDGDWARIECITEPSGAYTLCGAIAFTYTGPGAAALSGLEVERLTRSVITASV